MRKIKNIQGLQHSVKILSRFALFRFFSQEELLECFTKCEVREFNKNEIIHLQKERCKQMDLILEGKVLVQNIDQNGNVLTIDTFSSGDLIGANLLFSSRNTYPMTITGATKITTISMDKNLVLDLCHRNTGFMTGLLNEISDKTIILTEKLNTISRKSIRQGILEYLEQEKKKQGSNVIKLTLSKKELAERLGIPRSSLGRELNKMRKDGLVEYDAWTITLFSSEV